MPTRRRMHQARLALTARVRRHPRLDAALKRQFRRRRGLQTMRGVGRRRIRRGWGGAWLEWARVRAQVIRDRTAVYRCERIEWESPGVARLAPAEIAGPGPRQVMIRPFASAVSMGTERAALLDRQNMRGVFPRRPGYSLAGEIWKLGPRVNESFAIGDVVAARAPHASLVVATEDDVFRLPAGMSPEDAAFLRLGMIVLHGVTRGRLEQGERVAVLGRGPIGQLTVQVAHALGAGEVISVARTRRRDVSALKRYAKRIVSTDEDGMGVLDDLSADVTYEASGSPVAIIDALRATRDGGRVVLLGSPTDTTPAFPLPALADRNIELIGAHISTLPAEGSGSAWHERAAGERFLQLAAEGALDVASLISVEVDPQDAGVFYREVAEDREPWVGALIRWDALGERSRARSARVVTPPPADALLGREFRDADHRHRRAATLRRRPAGGTRSPVGDTRLGVAVVGMGRRGAEVASRVDLATHASLVRIVEARQGVARGVGNSLRVPWSTDLEAALEDDRVDVVFIATPHHHHADQAIESAQAGKHVIVEKPLAQSFDEARRIIDVGEATGVHVSPWLGFRYRPVPFHAKELVGAGVLGEVRGANLAHFLSHPPAFWFQDAGWRGARDTAGGGVLIMSGIHYLDWLLWLIDLPVTEVFATEQRVDPNTDVEEALALILTFENGAAATLNFSAAVPGLTSQTLTELRIWGRDGHLSLTPTPRFWSARAIAGRRASRWHRMRPPRLGHPDVEYLERFCAAILRGDPPEITAREGLRLQAVIEAAYESTRRGRPAAVSDPGL